MLVYDINTCETQLAAVVRLTDTIVAWATEKLPFVFVRKLNKHRGVMCLLESSLKISENSNT